MTDADRPACITHWSAIEGPDNDCYPGSDERLSINAALGRHLGLTRIGTHHERLLPGRRTSWPHAESAEEETVGVSDWPASRPDHAAHADCGGGKARIA